MVSKENFRGQKKTWQAKLNVTVMLTIFDTNGVVYHDFLQEAQTKFVVLLGSVEMFERKCQEKNTRVMEK